MSIKGVIVAAGYGTRLLPVTRVVPKELLPLVDRPCIAEVVDELAQAGIRDILLITSRRKRTLEDFFDHDPELEAALAGSTKLAKALPPDVRLTTVRQEKMGGTGDALRLARDFVGDGAAIVAFPDDLFDGDGPVPALIDVWRKTGASVLAAADLSGQDVSAYGVLDAVADDAGLSVRGIVEKPPRGTEPSSMISVGRYLYTGALFEALERLHADHRGGEYYPMAAMNEIAAHGLLRAATFAGRRYDTGNDVGYATAFLAFAAKRPDVRAALRAWLAENPL